eukprot:1043882_1
MIWNHRCRLKQHSLPTCVIFGVLNLLLILAIWMMTATTDESDILNYQIHDGESHTPQTKHHHIASSITDTMKTVLVLFMLFLCILHWKQKRCAILLVFWRLHCVSCDDVNETGQKFVDEAM